MEAEALVGLAGAGIVLTPLAALALDIIAGL